ncbi:MFS transporter [Dokdonella fugitiva]|jgi:MFS family permease|uniref:Sugar phosphate permease n=1 Tax=Dokdonella fugitiva TaxID=328517 RepID=A0A4R2I2J4_9GAMM|nr:MFS transporter [Dokdonella fugitiva]MBA8885525.1 MFS family permease [Dokdonella fugitiva]TCO38303.1 sugar phosphate permease [Dokdonella fugitiva]
MNAASPPPAVPVSFAALRHRGFRAYFLLSALAMMADNIEHVISYWVIHERFDSPALGGFAVVSHWLPFLLLSVYSGALADRVDPRRMIQLGMALFAGVSVAWGVLFVTGALQVWHAAALLVVHGMAGVLWGPPSQLLLHDIVGREHLQSAVRLNATARQLGMLMGPGIGGALLLWLGPERGILVNALLYLPFIAWLAAAPYGPKFRAAGAAVATRAVRTLGDIGRALREISHHRVILAMTLLAGLASLFVGNAYQAQMPGFAHDLGQAKADFYYSLLLGADAAGALTAGIVLESRGLLQPRARTACLLAMAWCVALGCFALTRSYTLAIPLLFVAGFVELSFNAMAQTLVQLDAPPEMRGRAIGVFTMFALGMRTFSGITVGLAGASIGIHGSLAASAAVLFIAIGLLLRVMLRGSSV